MRLTARPLTVSDAARKNGGTRKKSSMGTDDSGKRSSTWVMVCLVSI